MLVLFGPRQEQENKANHGDCAEDDHSCGEHRWSVAEGVSGAAPLMSTVDQALPVLSIGLHAAPPAVTCTWLAWRAPGKYRAFAPCPEKQTPKAL